VDGTFIYFAAAQVCSCCFSTIRFVHGGCRYTRSLRLSSKSYSRFIRALLGRKKVSMSSKRWKIWSFIISMSAQRLGFVAPLLAGASFGGWIAAEWATRYSDSLTKLILIDALGLRVEGVPAADILSFDPAAMRQAMFAEPTAAVAMETIPDTPKADDIVRTLLARRALARFAWQFPDDPRLHRYLHRVRVPTQIVWGERDGFVPAAHGQAYHEGIGGSEFKTIPNTGHLPHIEAPEICADIMSSFLIKT
jgi:pimeloyl-ACP methyl ester carboxylesterase